MLTLNDPLYKIPGVGKFISLKFKKIGIENVKDLLWHFPFRYNDFSKPKKIIELKEGENAAIQGTIKAVSSFRIPGRKLFITEALISDDTSSLKAIWFNQPFLRKIITKGKTFNFAGKVISYKGKLGFSSPSFEPASQFLHTFGLVPVYPETKGLTSKGIRKFIKKALESIDKIPEFLPSYILKKHHFPEINQALFQIHFPKKISQALESKKRFIFDNLFLLQLNNIINKGKLNKQKSYPFQIDFNLIKKRIANLPFKLTLSQRKSLFEILSDLKKDHPMNRLLQGEVGSGKTIVAALAALSVSDEDRQSVFMAPTEILAFQHYQTFKEFFPWFEKGIALLTSSQARVFFGEELESEIKKQNLIEQVKNNKIKIIFGTQSLIQKQVYFKKLGLVIVDEQHRFGVEQRAKLCRQTEKNTEEPTEIPHFLSMSATPIPRTLALTLFGDLNISTLTDLPANRKPVITKIISPSKQNEIYKFIREEIKKGNQAFIVCPRIETSEENAYSQNYENFFKSQYSKNTSNEIKNVKEEYEKLSKKIFPDLKVAMLHGKIKPKEKREIMEKFQKGEIDILVSTSVIEVGMDIPKATIMIIEGAERFGLAQIYQLRGRVGRRDKQSYCFLFPQSFSPAILKRLNSIITAKNALELAEKDLEIRGPGEILGGSQTGLPDLTMKAILNPELVNSAREEAFNCLKKDPTLNSFPILRDEITKFYREVHLE